MPEKPAHLTERLTRPEQLVLVALIALVAVWAGWRCWTLHTITHTPSTEANWNSEVLPFTTSD